MRAPDIRLAAALACVAVLACEGKTAPKPDVAAPAPQAAPAAAPTPTPTAAATPTATATPTPTATPTATPTKAPPAAQAAASSHAKAGAAKCKMCHRVQYESWEPSAHAKKGLDCEACHGNGADYWSPAVMKDRARATAAGLVIPTLATCRKCHANADAARLARVHAHKQK